MSINSDRVAVIDDEYSFEHDDQPEEITCEKCGEAREIFDGGLCDNCSEAQDEYLQDREDHWREEGE